MLMCWIHLIENRSGFVEINVNICLKFLDIHNSKNTNSLRAVLLKGLLDFY